MALVGTLLLAGIAINALTSAGIGLLVFVADDQQLRTLIFWTMGGFGGVTWTAIVPALLVLAISVPTCSLLRTCSMRWRSASARRVTSASMSSG